QDERLAERDRPRAGGAEPPPFGPPRPRREQRQRIETAVDEQRIAAPNRIHRRARLDRIGEREEVAGAAKADRDAAIRQRDTEIHVTNLALERPSCTGLPADARLRASFDALCAGNAGWSARW